MLNLVNRQAIVIGCVKCELKRDSVMHSGDFLKVTEQTFRYEHGIEMFRFLAYEVEMSSCNHKLSVAVGVVVVAICKTLIITLRDTNGHLIHSIGHDPDYGHCEVQT